MNNNAFQHVVTIALIVAVAFLGYLQYGAMQREAKIYETVEILQLQVDSLDGLTHIQQLQLDNLKQSSLPHVVNEAGSNISEGVGSFLEALEEQISDIRESLASDS